MKNYSEDGWILSNRKVIIKEKIVLQGGSNL